MKNKGKEFIVSVADWAFYLDDKLACTGTTNLSSAFTTAIQEQAVNAGKGNKKIYGYKYGREVNVNLEAADWKMEYLALQTGTKILLGAQDIYSLGECITLTAGVGTLGYTPTDGHVGIELPNGTYVDIATSGTSVDLTAYGLTTETVKATYRHSDMAKTIVIDTDSVPCVGRLVLQVDKHNSQKGKVGFVEVEVPSFALDGNFELNFTPEGVTSSALAGSALAVEGDSCADGSSIYAYIKETNTDDVTVALSEVALNAPGALKVGGTLQLSVTGIVSQSYRPIEINLGDCTFSIVDAGSTGVTVGGRTGVLTGATASGTAKVKVVYGDLSDECDVTVIR